MARPPVPVVERSARLRPQAEITDAYVRPPTPPRSHLHQLADALRSVSSDLGGFMRERDEKAAAEARLRGAAAFYSSTGPGQAAAVASGQMPSHYSPHFMKGYRNAEGDLAGIKLKQQFDAAYSTWDGKDSGDDQAFDTFLRDFLSKNISPNQDAEVLRGLVPRVDELFSHGYRKFTEDSAQGTYERSLDTQAARMGQALDGWSTEGLSEGTGTDYAGLHRELMTQREEAVRSGIRAADIDQRYVDAVTAKAIEHKDPALLALLDQPIPSKNGVKYSDIPYGRDEKQKSVEKLETVARQQVALERQDAERERKLEDEAVTREVMSRLGSNPDEPIPEDTLRRGEKVDAEFRAKVLRWRETFQRGEGREEEAALVGITRDIMDGDGAAAIKRGLENGTIQSSDTLQKLWRFNEAASKPEGRDILQGPVASGFRNTIKERTTAPDWTNPFAPDGWSDAGLRALTDYESRLIQWRADNPNAKAEDIREAQHAIGKRILDAIRAPEGDTPTYERERAMGSPPQPAPLPPPSPTQRDDATPAPSPAPKNAEAERWWNGLTSVQRDLIGGRARQEGTPLEVFRDRAFENLRKRTDQPQRQNSIPAPTPQRQESAAPSATRVSEVVPAASLSKIIQIESGGDPRARAKTSSATGLGQFVSKTWLKTVRKHRPDLIEGRPTSQVLALRSDPRLAIEMLARHTEDNLEALGGDATDGALYLAHFAGAPTAKRLLAAERRDPSTPASKVFSREAMEANASILDGKTVRQVRLWAERKMARAGTNDWVGRYVAGL